jgi:hypothetical protein
MTPPENPKMKTTNTTDRLARIRALCVENLAKAANRTPGKWWNEDGHAAVFAMTPKCRPNGEGLLQVNYYGRYVGKDAHADAAYIAACAGAAEAGWKATIAAIDDVLERGNGEHSKLGAAILAAWEGQV